MVIQYNYSSSPLILRGLSNLQNLVIHFANLVDIKNESFFIFLSRENQKTMVAQLGEVFGSGAQSILTEALKTDGFNGNLQDNCTALIMTKNIKRIFFYGLGNKSAHPYEVIDSTIKETYADAHTCFKAGQDLGDKVSKYLENNFCLCIEESIMTPLELRVFFEGFLFGILPDYRFKTNNKRNCKLSKLFMYVYNKNTSLETTKHFEIAIQESVIHAGGIQLTRELVNSPANMCTTETLAMVASKIAKTFNFDCKILSKEECEQLNMGAYLAVHQGSSFAPKFIHLIYKPKLTKKKIALIGKGICMDTGGYNLKINKSIATMKIDMSGAAAVLGAAHIIGVLKPNFTEVHFIIPAAENMIDKLAYRPGDIIFASNKKSIEVLNTDAEGRLTLADALIYAEKEVKANEIIECSTLTGAIRIALGPDIAAVYSKSKKLLDTVMESGFKTGTALWPMPLYKPYSKMNESKIADISNAGSSPLGGSIQAALFLNEFVEKTPFCHIDLAGPVTDEHSNLATGYGATLLSSIVISSSEKLIN